MGLSYLVSECSLAYSPLILAVAGALSSMGGKSPSSHIT